MAAASNISDKELFWQRVEKTDSLYEPDSAVIIKGKRFADRAEDLRNEMFRACTRTEPFAEEFFKSPPAKVLDLGSGIGSNSRPMAKNGAHVSAIDNSIELLQFFSTRSVMDGCPEKNIRLRRGDITTMKTYGEDFNLVLATDILPYVSPKNLHSTMEKIQKCLAEKGILIGTIFTTNSDPAMREFISNLGGHFYEGGRKFTEELLEHSGFLIEKIEKREEGGYRFKAIKAPTNK
jgi:cyclopropane fatty-acyl-phospholipid synthase-like methyltransferase